MKYYSILFLLLSSCTIPVSKPSEPWDNDINNFSDLWTKSIVTQDCMLRDKSSLSSRVIKTVRKGTKILTQKENAVMSSAYVIPDIGFISNVCIRNIDSKLQWDKE